MEHQPRLALRLRLDDPQPRNVLFMIEPIQRDPVPRQLLRGEAVRVLGVVPRQNRRRILRQAEVLPVHAPVGTDTDASDVPLVFLGPAMYRVIVALEPPIADDHAFAAGLRRTCDPPRVLPLQTKLAAVGEHDLVPFVGEYLVAVDVDEILLRAPSASLCNL